MKYNVYMTALTIMKFIDYITTVDCHGVELVRSEANDEISYYDSISGRVVFSYNPQQPFNYTYTSNQCRTVWKVSLSRLFPELYSLSYNQERLWLKQARKALRVKHFV